VQAGEEFVSPPRRNGLAKEPPPRQMINLHSESGRWMNLVTVIPPFVPGDDGVAALDIQGYRQNRTAINRLTSGPVQSEHRSILRYVRHSFANLRFNNHFSCHRYSISFIHLKSSALCRFTLRRLVLRPADIVHHRTRLRRRKLKLNECGNCGFTYYFTD
jgi:hypothetical protein